MEQPDKKEETGEAKKNEAYLYKSEPKSWGSLISLIIVIAVIVIGAFYAWGKRIEHDRGENNQNLPTFKVEANGQI